MKKMQDLTAQYILPDNKAYVRISMDKTKLNKIINVHLNKQMKSYF